MMLYLFITSDMPMKPPAQVYRRWAGKTSYVYLALNMYLLSNILKELSEISFIHVPGPQIIQHKPLNVFEAMEHVLN